MIRRRDAHDGERRAKRHLKGDLEEEKEEASTEKKSIAAVARTRMEEERLWRLPPFAGVGDSKCKRIMINDFACQFLWPLNREKKT